MTQTFEEELRIAFKKSDYETYKNINMPIIRNYSSETTNLEDMTFEQLHDFVIYNLGRMLDNLSAELERRIDTSASKNCKWRRYEPLPRSNK